MCEGRSGRVGVAGEEGEQVPRPCGSKKSVPRGNLWGRWGTGHELPCAFKPPTARQPQQAQARRRQGSVAGRRELSVHYASRAVAAAAFPIGLQCAGLVSRVYAKARRKFRVCSCRRSCSYGIAVTSLYLCRPCKPHQLPPAIPGDVVPDLLLMYQRVFLAEPGRLLKTALAPEQSWKY